MPATDAPRTTLALIAAMASNQAIGQNNALPWRLPEDLKRFRVLTTGHRIIMGRKTFESLGRPLPQRENVVLTRSATFKADGCRVLRTIDEALADAADTVFCIGGAEIYRLAIGRAQRIYLTEIDHAFGGDAFFPAINRDEWHETSRETHRLEGRGGFPYHFVVYDRAKL